MALLSEAQRHEAFFSALLDRVPHHLILPRNDEEEERETGAARYFKVPRQLTLTAISTRAVRQIKPPGTCIPSLNT